MVESAVNSNRSGSVWINISTGKRQDLTLMMTLMTWSYR